MRAQEPPELPPMVARAVRVFAQGDVELGLDAGGGSRFRRIRRSGPTWCRIRGPRSEPWASPEPFWMEMAIMAGTLPCAMRLSRVAKRRGSGPSAPTIKGAGVPGTYCLGM